MTMAETYSGKFSTSSETQGQSVGLGEKAGRSFQLRAKEPLGTYSILTELFPKIQADAVSWLGTKNALYYCAKSTNSFFWVLFVSSYTTAICPVLSPSLCLQGKLLFSTFLTTNLKELPTLLPVLENCRPAFSPDPTDCLWVSEDVWTWALPKTIGIDRLLNFNDHKYSMNAPFNGAFASKWAL